MTQTLLEESKLLNKSGTPFHKDDSLNLENDALIKAPVIINGDRRNLKSPPRKYEHENIDLENDCEGNDCKCLKNGADILMFDSDLVTDENSCNCPKSVEQTDKEKLGNFYKHLYPEVVVKTSQEFSDIDSDEEDFQLRRHRKNDSGQGSSVETSSIKSNPPQDFYQVDINFDRDSINSLNNETIDSVLNDADFSLNDTLPQTTRHSSFSSTRVESKSNSSFTDIPLNTPSPVKNLNTFMPAKYLESEDHTLIEPRLKPPQVTDKQGKQGLLKRSNQKSWKIFGKVAVPVAKEPSPSVSPTSLRKQKKETVGSSTTALIFENRPSHLPPKSAKEELKHRQQYEEMIAFAKKKELKDQENERKKQKERQKLENQISNIVKTWKEDVIPNWENCKSTRKVRDLWWSGIPPSVRGKVWSLAIGNDLNITKELFHIFQDNAKERIRNQRNPEPVATLHDSESSLVVSKENTVGLITLDVSRTFPALCIFQKGGPYHEPLKHLLAAYTCFRPDVGYVQGMSFLAAMLLLNLDAPDAFVAFANLINRPCQMAFFTVDQPMMDAYFKTFDVLIEDQIPRLYAHMKEQCLSHDIYLIDWIFTLFSKSLPLDTACRVWDLFCRDGEEFLFRTGLGILLMNEEILLDMEFFRLAQYLTKLSNTITPSELFKYIEKINFSKQKLTQTLNHFKQLAKTSPWPPT